MNAPQKVLGSCLEARLPGEDWQCMEFLLFNSLKWVESGRIKLTYHTDYAFRILIYLKAMDAEELAKIGEIAEAYNISQNQNSLSQNKNI